MGKTPDEIRAEIEAARGKLAEGVRGLASEVHPSIVKEQVIQQAKAAVNKRVNSVKALVVDDAGVRWDRIGTVVLAGTALIIASRTLRGLGRWLRH